MPKMFLRIDPDQEGTVFRGATISNAELDALRSIRDVPHRKCLRRRSSLNSD